MMSRSKHHGTTAFPAVRAMAAKSEVPAAGDEDRLPLDGQDGNVADHVAAPVADAGEGMASPTEGGEKSHAEASADTNADTDAYELLTAPIAAAEKAGLAAMAAVRRDRMALRLLPGDDVAKYVCALTEAAKFIRTGGPNTDGNVLWNHLWLSGFHETGINSWRDLPFALRLGWSTFGAVLLAFDTFAAEEAAKRRTPAAEDIYRVPIDETTLEPVGGMFDRFDDKP